MGQAAQLPEAVAPVVPRAVPAGQFAQRIAPVPLAYVPTRQLVQVADPAVRANVPGAHAVQLVVVAAKKPGPHGGDPCARIPGIDSSHTTPATKIMLRKSCSAPGQPYQSRVLVWLPGRVRPGTKYG